MLKDELEIFIITYNRKQCLENTLASLTSLDCPIRDFEFKILDNASDDGTKEFCENFVSEHRNFKYIKNPRNLGISGNIIKTMEMASKKWLWTLCDDDSFDWTGWNEIEEALNGDYDIVHTTYTEGFRSENVGYIINEEAFIPTCIYNTRNIDSTVMQNAYAMAYTLLPHHAIGCKVIGNKGKIYVPQNRVVHQSYDDKCNFIRAEKAGLFHRLNNYQLLAGYLEAYSLITDISIRKECTNVLCLGQNFENSMKWFLDNNPRGDLYNIFGILIGADKTQRKSLVKQILNSNHNKNNYEKLISELKKCQKTAKIELFLTNFKNSIIHFVNTTFFIFKCITKVLFIRRF